MKTPNTEKIAKPMRILLSLLTNDIPRFRFQTNKPQIAFWSKNLISKHLSKLKSNRKQTYCTNLPNTHETKLPFPFWRTSIFKPLTSTFLRSKPKSLTLLLNRHISVIKSMKKEKTSISYQEKELYRNPTEIINPSSLSKLST